MGRHRDRAAKAIGARPAQAAPMKGHELDLVDIRILDMLRKDGRATYVALGERIGMTSSATLRRTQALQDQNVIRGYRAELDHKKLGYSVMTFIVIGLSSQTERAVKAFEAATHGLTFVRECYALFGQRDFLLKCVFRNLSESNAFVTDVLLKIPNVATVTTYFCVAMTKDEPGVPLTQVDAKPAPVARRRLGRPRAT